jgi:hypothetical protein
MITNNHIEGFLFDYGIQMAYTIDSVRTKKDSCGRIIHRDLKEDVKLLFGLTFSTQARLNSTLDSLAYTYVVGSSSGTDIIMDTIRSTSGYHGKITIPVTFGIGVGIKKGLRWMVVADVKYQNWGDYSFYGNSQGLRNTMRASIGAQYTPSPRINSTAGYFKRINYRWGLRYAETGLELKGQMVNQYAITAGLGLPIGRVNLLQFFSMANIGLEIGQRGTVQSGLLKENYFRLSIGFTLNDKWFRRAVYD